MPRFFVAEPVSPAARLALSAEQDAHSDLEVLVGRAEAYAAVPHQTLAMLQHFTNTSLYGLSVLWIVKTDDDVFLRADAALRALLATSHLHPTGARIYSGWMVKGAAAHRNGKWAVTKQEWPATSYPEYASGPTYALTASLARQVLKLHRQGVVTEPDPARTQGSPRPVWLRLEDVAMGLWIEAVEARVRVFRRDDRRFYKGRFCVPWSVSVLLEQGRPLFFLMEDVRRAMVQLLHNENASLAVVAQEAGEAGSAESDVQRGWDGDGDLWEVVCPAGTRREDAQARVECQQVSPDADDVVNCARWLAAAEKDGRGQAAYTPQVLGNLYPGGSPALQRKAEGAVLAEAEEADREWRRSASARQEWVRTRRQRESERQQAKAGAGGGGLAGGGSRPADDATSPGRSSAEAAAASSVASRARGSAGAAAPSSMDGGAAGAAGAAGSAGAAVPRVKAKSVRGVVRDDLSAYHPFLMHQVCAREPLNPEP